MRGKGILPTILESAIEVEKRRGRKRLTIEDVLKERYKKRD